MDAKILAQLAERTKHISDEAAVAILTEKAWEILKRRRLERALNAKFNAHASESVH